MGRVSNSEENELDVCKRRIAALEEELRKSESKWRSVLEHTHQIGVSLDPEGRIVFANKHLLELTGWEFEEIRGRSWFDLFLPEQVRGSVREVFKTIMDKRDVGPHSQFQNEIITRDGSIRKVSWFNVLSLDSFGEILDITCLGIDLTAESEAREASKQAHKAMRLNMAHLRTLVETIPELVWVKDGKGVYVFCNHRFERLYGASEEQIVGKTDYDFVDKELADFFARHDRAAMKAGRPTINEESVTYADDGHTEELETIKTPMYDDQGNLIGVLGVARDMTARNRIAQELKESEIRFKALHNASFGGIAIHDKGVIIDCNQGLADISGYTLEELVGMDGLLLIAESSRELVMRNILAGYEKPYEAVGLTKNGEEYPIQLEARNIPYKGKSARVVEFRDISSRKKAEEELKDSELRHRVIFENSPLGMIRFNEEGRITDCNDLFVELMGSSREALIGFHTLKHSNPKMREALDKAIHGEPSSYEDYYTSVTGKKQTYINVRFNPVNIGQFPTEVIASLEDFSERKDAQDRLRLAKEEAEAFSRSKTEFLTNMSHEIRTPLNGILGMLQLMQATDLDEEQSDYIADAIQASKRLTNLLSDILDLSRVEAGKLRILNSPFDLKESCKQVVDLYRLTSDQSGVALLSDIDPDIPPFVVGDSIRVQQVLTNLLGNAFKFTEKGSIALTASLLPVSREGKRRVLFQVADTGKGIPDDKLESLFESFTQLSQGYARQHQGAGLGLAICKQLVDLMNGTIDVESEEGVGTSIYVSIPFGQCMENVAVPADTIARVSPAKQTNLRVLLAEDERVNSLVTKRLLEKAGHSVIVAGNGREAIEALSKNPFDVILMDIQMPVMDGVAATAAIRAGAAGKESAKIPIAALTAYAMVGDREKFLNAGMDGYVVKPIDLNQLQDFLNSI